MNWTDERFGLMKKLWAEGLSASSIAARLGGTTRNAVIAKVHRSGLAGRIKPAHVSRQERRATRARAKAKETANAPAKANAAPPMPKPVTPYVERKPRVFNPAKMVTFAGLDDKHCRFPVGDPREHGFAYCGELRSSGLPYCPQCAAVAYQPPQIAARPVAVAAGGQNGSGGHLGPSGKLPAAGGAPKRQMEEAQ